MGCRGVAVGSATVVQNVVVQSPKRRGARLTAQTTYLAKNLDIAGVYSIATSRRCVRMAAHGHALMALFGRGRPRQCPQY